MTILTHFTSATGNHLWQSTVLAAVAWLLTLALRKNQARTRYWVWMIASVKFLVPFSLLITMGGYLRGIVATPVTARPEFSVVMEQITVPFAPLDSGAAIAPAVIGHGGSFIPIFLLGVWLCGFLFVAFSWGRKWWRVRAAVCAASRSAIVADVPVLSSHSLLEPGIFGIVRPVLMLPEGITERLTPAQVDAIIAHEMCHVRRRDNLTAAIHMFVEAAFWFHPMVWWIGSRMVEERERACDEEVLRLGGDPEVYAEGILNVCKFYVESPLSCVSGISGSDLKKRIVRIMTERVASNLNLSRKLLLSTAALLAIATPIVFGLDNATRLHAQSPASDWETAAGGKMSFDVASVKQNKSGFPPSGNTPSSNIPLGNGAVYSPTGGLLSTTNYQLSLYISFAYKLTANDTKSLVSQLPKWATTDRFDIQARAKGNPTQDQMRLMMQSLLSDRFKLVVHRETRQLPVFTVVLLAPGKTGPQLRVHADDGSCSNAPPPLLSPGSATAPSATVPGGFPATCGGLVRMPASTPGRMRMGARNLSMGLIASWLTALGSLDRPVLDQTGLTGTFDFYLEWAPEFNGPPPPGVDFQPDPTGPTFLEATKEQLGLMLESQTGPVDVFVVDHIEEPSEN